MNKIVQIIACMSLVAGFLLIEGNIIERNNPAIVPLFWPFTVVSKGLTLMRLPQDQRVVLSSLFGLPILLYYWVTLLFLLGFFRERKE